MSQERLTRLTGSSGPGPFAGPGTSTGPCGANDCPNVYATERGTFVIQGNLYSGFPLPDGEGTVEIPEDVLREAVRVLGW